MCFCWQFSVFSLNAPRILFFLIYIYIYVYFLFWPEKKQPTSCYFPEDSRRTH